MDLNQGFMQLPIAEEDRDKTAIATTMGLFQFLRLPYGLVTAPSEFSRLMGEVLRGMQWRECLVYMDDIIVPCSVVQQGLIRLEHVFQRLRAANLKLKPKKCSFFQKSVKVLGHIVSSEGIRTDHTKTEAVRDWPTPQNAKDLKSFLGLSAYYMRFVENYSNIAKPLYKLCSKSIKFTWTEEAEKSFQALKTALTTTPILAYPISGLPFSLDTDCSKFASGAVLGQVQNGKERVIAYMSKTLTPSEIKYCVTRKELLAVVTALKHFHHYLYGQEVLLRTDNAAVSWLRRLKDPCGQMARWLQYIDTYNLKITHRPGRLHANADALSRNPCKVCARYEKSNSTVNNVREIVSGNNSDQNETVCVTTRLNQQSVENEAPRTVLLDGWSATDIKMEQLQDPDIGPLLVAAEAKERPDWNKVAGRSANSKLLWNQWDRLEVHGGVLHRRWLPENGIEKLQLIVPKTKRIDLLYFYHDIPTAGHLGVDKMLDRIRNDFFWPAITQDVKNYCAKCIICAARKPSKPAHAPLGETAVGAMMEKVAMDILGPLPTTDKGNRYVLVIADVFTKYTEAVALPDQEAKTVATAFVDTFVTRMGTPMTILSDQGTNFESELFKDMCSILGIKKISTSVARPQANSVVERFNRTLLTMLTAYCSENQKSWDIYLQQVMMAFRASKSASTGFTPNLMAFGREVTLPVTAVIGLPPGEHLTPSQHVNNLQNNMVKAHEIARHNLQKNAQYQKRYYDRSAKDRKLQVGQPVWLFEPSKKPCKKLAPRWQGPYLVVKIIDDLIYMIKKSLRKPAKAHHIDKLRPYNGNELPKWFKRVL
jgi:transposase InsO family protein